MPEISRFFGIVIYMNWREHPPMHFHAVYGDYEALFTIDGKVYAGSLPGRATSMVREGSACTAKKLNSTGNWPSKRSR